MTAPRILGVAIGRFERRAGEFFTASLAVLREEVRAEPVDEAAECREFFATLKGSRYD